MWGRKEDTRWSEQACGSRYRYKEWGNMECFENLIIVFDSILYNIPYGIVETFSLIHGCTHGWSNHVKTLCTMCVIVLSLCSWTNIVSIKTFAGTTNWHQNFRCHNKLVWDSSCTIGWYQSSSWRFLKKQKISKHRRQRQKEV